MLRKIKLKDIKTTQSCRSAPKKLAVLEKWVPCSKYGTVTCLKFVTKIYKSFMSRNVKDTPRVALIYQRQELFNLKKH